MRSPVVTSAPRRVFTILVALAVFVALAELIFRTVIFPNYTAMMPDIFVPHRVFGHYNKPNITVRRFSPMNYDVTNRTNSMGFRGREENLSRELRGIWIGGSSNTFGGGVEDADVFSARLKSFGFDAANISSEGHNLPNQVMVLRHLVESGYRPKAVVIGLPMVHAIRDYSEAYGAFTRPLGDTGDVNATPVALSSAMQAFGTGLAGLWDSVPKSFTSVRARLIKNSAIYGWLKVGIMGVPSLRHLTLRLGLRADLDLVYKGELDLLRPSRSNGDADRLMESTADYISAIRDLIRDRLGVPFGVVFLPNHHQIYPDRFRRYVAHFGLEGEELDPARPLNALHDRLAAKSIPVLDTLPFLRAANDQMLIFPDDAHLNAEGHAIVAKAIAQWLTRDLHVSSGT